MYSINREFTLLPRKTSFIATAVEQPATVVMITVIAMSTFVLLLINRIHKNL